MIVSHIIFQYYYITIFLHIINTSDLHSMLMQFCVLEIVTKKICAYFLVSRDALISTKLYITLKKIVIYLN